MRPSGAANDSTRLEDALARVADALPYLRAVVGEPPGLLRDGEELADGRWLCCDRLLGDHDWLRSVVRGAGRRLSAPDDAVASSIFVQGYSYRALATAISCYLLGGALPSSRPEVMAVAFSKGRPVSVAYRQARLLVIDGACRPAAPTAQAEKASDDRAGPSGKARPPGRTGPLAGADGLSWAGALEMLLEDAVEAHMRPLVTAVRSCFKVGRRLLWGNVAASGAVAFRTVEGLLGPAVKPLGEAFFALAPPELKGLGSFATVEHGGRSAWYWERRNCCLYDRLPGGVRCADCSKRSAEERRASYLAVLEEEVGAEGGQ